MMLCQKEYVAQRTYTCVYATTQKQETFIIIFIEQDKSSYI